MSEQKGKILIRTLICEDARLIRAGLVALLSQSTDIEVVAQLQSSDRLVPVVSTMRPDVTVIDIDVPGGPAALAQLRADLPCCRVLALLDRENLGRARRSVTAYAQGLILKTAPLDLVLAAVRRVAAGGRVVDPDIAQSSVVSGNPLTPRETDVLRVAAQGVSTAEIARRLGLSPGTVRNYISQAIIKTGTRNRLDAIRAAEMEGWLLPPAQ